MDDLTPGLNGVDLDAPDDDAYELVMAVAGGQCDLAAIAQTRHRWH